MKTERTGIVYSATGQSFADQAVQSAKSSLRFNDLPHLLFSDVPPNETVPGVDVVIFESSGNPFIDKINNICRSPFPRSIYLDCDTYVLSNLEELFALLTRFDLAAAHAPGYTKCGDDEPPNSLYDFNTGVIVFRAVPSVQKFLARWRAIHETWSKRAPFPIRHIEDQPAFRRALWECNSVSFYVLGPEYNFRPAFCGRVVGSVKIIHGRGGNHEALAAYLNAQEGPRIFPPFLEAPLDFGFR